MAADDETSSSQPQTTRRGRLFGGLVAGMSFFAVASVCLSAVLIWQNQTRLDNGGLIPSDKPFKCPQKAEEIRSKFRGYFYVVEDRDRMKQLGLQQHRPVVNNSIRMPNVSFTSSTTTTITTTSAPSRNRRQIIPQGFCSGGVYNKSDLSVHACCISYSDLVDPSSLPTGEPDQNGNVTIYQLPDYKQYFRITRCW